MMGAPLPSQYCLEAQEKKIVYILSFDLFLKVKLVSCTNTAEYITRIHVIRLNARI